MFKAALFDLDGVIFDTEPQYTKFWGAVGRKYFPEIADFEHGIKGSTLQQIYDKFLPDDEARQREITQSLYAFERRMTFSYVAGAEEFINSLRRKGMLTAVVTSSNLDKMANVYAHHAEFKPMFDAILTSEDFSRGKPAPDCYLLARQRLGLDSDDCMVFEDSINGMMAAKAAGMYLVGVATTNSRETVARYADVVIDNFREEIGRIETLKQ